MKRTATVKVTISEKCVDDDGDLSPDGSGEVRAKAQSRSGAGWFWVDADAIELDPLPYEEWEVRVDPPVGLAFVVTEDGQTRVTFRTANAEQDAHDWLAAKRRV